MKLLGRQYQLLQLLIENKENYLSASYYCKKLSVSTKTIYQDLNQLIELGGDIGVTIKRVPAKGIKIVGNNKQLTSLINLMEKELKHDQYSPERRRIDIIKNILLANEKVTLESMSKKYYVSKTSLYNDITYINRIFTGNVKIISDTNGVRIRGEEIEIQRAIIQVILHFSNLNTESSFESILLLFFDKSLVEMVYKIILQDYRGLVLDVSDYYIQSLISSVIVQIARLKIGHHISNEKELTNNVNTNYDIDDEIREIYKLFASNSKVDFNDLDQQYFSRQFYAHRIIDSIDLVKSDYIQSIEAFIKKMSHLERINFNTDERLIESLTLHVPAMILRLQLGVHIQNPMLRGIRESHSVLFSEVWYASSIFESKYDISMNDDEVSLLVMHFQIAIEKYKKNNNIIIVCQYGMTSAQLIYSKVRKFLPKYDNVRIVMLEELNEIDHENIDLIISSVDIPIEGLPIVKVTPLINNQDYINIITSYTNQVLDINYDSLENLNENNRNEKISQYINKDLIFTGLTFSNKEVFLNFSIDKIEETELVTNSFRKSIFDREKIGSTGLESGVALPHADPSTIIKSHIAIFSLKNEIEWEETKVKLVIFVNFNDQDINEIKEVIMTIHDLINSKEKVKIITDLNKNEFISFMKNGRK